MTEFYYFKRISSTITYIRRNIEHFKNDALVMAENQIAGRGRLGRSWASPEGGCWFSYLKNLKSLKNTEGMGYESAISLVVGLACAEALEDMSALHIEIKWPNDLMTDEKKIGGILCEIIGERIIMGIGINTNFSTKLLPKNLMVPAISTYDLGKYLDNIELAWRCKKKIDNYIGRYDDVIGKIRSKLCTIGRDVRILTPSGEIVGTAKDIDIDGSLIVLHNERIEKVYSGDCIHLR